MYTRLIKPLFFLFSPERAHTLAMRGYSILLHIPLLSALVKRMFCLQDPSLHRKVAGLDFPNPVGLAAGFDKDGKYLRALEGMGFGFVELGTVTPRPQPGNPKPRLFRLPKDAALINRMGFNNEGVEALAARLQHKETKMIIGGNIGKNKGTPNEEAAADYVKCFEILFPLVDYFAVNVSSPNTPDLRELQDREPLSDLLGKLQERNRKREKPKPIFLKIAPDMGDPQIDDVISIIRESGIAGIILTNTTVGRKNLRSEGNKIEKIGPGGLSGAPLRQRSTEIVRFVAQRSKGAFSIIAVGGIASPEDAREKLEAGADLIQIYTGLIYKGPGLIKAINRSLLPS